MLKMCAYALCPQWPSDRAPLKVGLHGHLASSHLCNLCRQNCISSTTKMFQKMSINNLFLFSPISLLPRPPKNRNSTQYLFSSGSLTNTCERGNNQNHTRIPWQITSNPKAHYALHPKLIMLLGKRCVSQHRFLKNARAISCAEWWVITLPEHVHVFSARDAMSSAHGRTMLRTHLHTICGLSRRFVSQVPPLHMYTQCPARNRARERVRDVDMWCLLGTQCHSQGRRRNMRTVLCPQLWIRTCFAHASAGHRMCFTKSPFHSVHIMPCTKSFHFFPKKNGFRKMFLLWWCSEFMLNLPLVYL